MNLAIWDIESSSASTDFGSIIEIGGILLDQNFKNLLKKFLVLLKKIEIWNEKNIDECIRYFITSEKIKFVDFGKPLRYLITNQKEGISLSLIIFLLEKKKVLLRISNYLNK